MKEHFWLWRGRIKKTQLEEYAADHIESIRRLEKLNGATGSFLDCWLYQLCGGLAGFNTSRILILATTRGKMIHVPEPLSKGWAFHDSSYEQIDDEHKVLFDCIRKSVEKIQMTWTIWQLQKVLRRHFDYEESEFCKVPRLLKDTTSSTLSSKLSFVANQAPNLTKKLSLWPRTGSLSISRTHLIMHRGKLTLLRRHYAALNLYIWDKPADSNRWTMNYRRPLFDVVRDGRKSRWSACLG